jgi:hypothetical protein
MAIARSRKPEVFLAGLALLICLGYAAFTGHVWEDYWITCRASHNLATGQGLVYTPGERLHTFTSPLGVLLPAAFCWLTGGQHDQAALWLFRTASAAALGGALVLLFLSLRSVPVRRVSLWLTLGLIALDGKIVDFSINGMEIGLLILFAALAVHGLLVEGPRQIWRLGAGWAGMMWTRPDGWSGVSGQRPTAAGGFAGLRAVVPAVVFVGVVVLWHARAAYHHREGGRPAGAGTGGSGAGPARVPLADSGGRLHQHSLHLSADLCRLRRLAGGL